MYLNVKKLCLHRHFCLLLTRRDLFFVLYAFHNKDLNQTGLLTEGESAT